MSAFDFFDLICSVKRTENIDLVTMAYDAWPILADPEGDGIILSPGDLVIKNNFRPGKERYLRKVRGLEPVATIDTIHRIVMGRQFLPSAAEILVGIQKDSWDLLLKGHKIVAYSTKKPADPQKFIQTHERERRHISVHVGETTLYVCENNWPASELAKLPIICRGQIYTDPRPAP